jgi:hypothetical protein
LRRGPVCPSMGMSECKVGWVLEFRVVV